jgi:peptide-methionine (S)-S-oxide reductase
VTRRRLARFAVILPGLALGAGLLMAGPVMGTAPPVGQVIPPPEVDERPSSAESEVAVLAGGCFWGVQGVFQHVDGVTSAVSGYAGGEAETAHYDIVGTGTTGHAEVVEITFDPASISFGQILHIYFSVAHDPTQVDRQGPDIGTQYRSAIFPVSEEQSRVARAYIDQLDQADVFDEAIATTIESDGVFFPAEDYHQDFMELNPTHPYIVQHDLPKVEALQVLFPDAFRAEPALVGEADSAG